MTASPCWNCFKQLANAGITRICYGEFYRDDRIFEVATKIGIELVHVGLPGVLARGTPADPARLITLRTLNTRQGSCRFLGMIP